MLVSWVLAPCGFVDRCQRFGETCCLHLQGWSNKAIKWRAYIGLEERRPRERANQREGIWERIHTNRGAFKQVTRKGSG
jgi:hypothetical protein